MNVRLADPAAVTVFWVNWKSSRDPSAAGRKLRGPSVGMTASKKVEKEEEPTLCKPRKG
jgi:hypothetical protein